MNLYCQINVIQNTVYDILLSYIYIYVFDGKILLSPYSMKLMIEGN